MQAENNNDIAITEAKLKDFLSSVLSSEGIVVDIRRTFIEYNGVNRSRVFARHANRMACKGSNEKFVVIALLCYPALQWLLKAQDIDALIEKLKEENEDESVWRMSNIQRILESSMGGCKPQLRLEMRKLFFARCQQLVDEIDEAMNKDVPAKDKFKKDKKAEVKEDKKPEGDKKVAKPAKKGGSNVILGVSCAVMVAAVGVMGMTMVQNKNADKSSIPAVGGSFSVTGNIAEDTSFTEQAAVAPSTALTSDGRQWAMGASNILIQAEDGTGAVVPVDAAETFQYDGKSLSFEKDGATYIVRMVADSYTGAAQYAEEQTDESFTVSGMRFAGNGQELVVVGTRSAGDEEGNAAVRTAVADMLEKAVPAQGSGNITLNGVAVTADGCEASFSNGLALIKSGDGEVKFTPSSYDSETIAFDDAGTTASGAAVTHSDYANVNDTEAYLIESDEGNVMAFTNNADLLTSVLGLQ